ncbi:MAG: hypothetical protein VYA67_21910 [Actinomycetota bacterium]|nr:hypothetical protein [Actinomycetota bacterium]
MAWPKTADGQWYIFEGQVLMPVDPTTGAPVILLRPQGGMGQSIPAVADGPPGKHAEIAEAINFNELAWDDPTQASMSWTTLVPPTDDDPGVYKLNASLHGGRPGEDGNTVLDPADFENPLPGKFPAIKSDGTAFELQTQKVGGLYLPETINSTPSGQSLYTLAQIPVPAQDFAWRPRVIGWCDISGTGADVRVDLIARLNTEASGNIVSRAVGKAGQAPPRHVLDSLPPAGSGVDYYRVNKGSSAVIYVRAEKQSGNDNFTTSASTSAFGVEVVPLP